MKTKIKFAIIFLATIIVLTTTVFAIKEIDNGIMKVYPTLSGFEFDGMKGFDIQGYIDTESGKELISSSFGDYGYHTFLNVDGKHGPMDEPFDVEGEKVDVDDDGYGDLFPWEIKFLEMQYTEVEEDGDGWQNIDGIDLKVATNFINNGEQLQIIYTLKNTKSESARYSLGTVADVQIDEDDSATIDRLDDGSGVRLWTKDGRTEKPVQFVFYGKDVNGTTDIDNLYISGWEGGQYMANMFTSNNDVVQIKDRDSAFTFAWTDREIKAGETITHTVLMEVGEVNIPNTGLRLENGKKFYYTDVKFDGTVLDADLKDNIIVHYVIDGTEYELPVLSTTGTSKDFQIDLTSLNLEPGVEHIIKVWATDSTDCESNVEERTFSVTYLKNHELSVSKEEWTNEDVTFKITDEVNEAEFVSKYQYSINGGDWIDCEKDADIPVDLDGVIRIDSRIVGSKTNDYSDIITKFVKIDRTAPTTTGPTASATTSTVTVVPGQTDAHSGVDESKTMYSIKIGDTWTEWQEENTFTDLVHDTEYVVKTKTTDMSGNVSESEETIIKTELLVVGNLILKYNNNEGENYTENTWTNENIYVAVEEVQEGVTTSYVSTEDSAQKIESTNQETTVVEDGNTKITLSATDGTNVVVSDVEHVIKIDKVAPVINELSLDNEEWTVEGKVLTGKAIDILSGLAEYQFSKIENLTVDSEGWLAVTPVTVEEVTETVEITESGKYYFYVKDAAGNMTSVGIDTKIDDAGPVITFSRANGETEINVTDIGSGTDKTVYAWTEENEEPTEWLDYEKAVTYSGESKDAIYLWAKATDDVGNETVNSTVFTEIKMPIIETKDKFTNEYANFKLNSENTDEDITYQYRIDGEEWKNISEDSTYTISNINEGEIKIEARVLDNAGRYSEIATKNVEVIFIAPPTPDNNQTGENTVITNTTITNTSGDNTTSPGILPATGTGFFIILVISLVLIASIAGGKIILYRDVK